MGLFSKIFGKKKNKQNDAEVIAKPAKQNEEQSSQNNRPEESEKSGDIGIAVAEKEKTDTETVSEKAKKSKSGNLYGFFEIKKSRDERYVFNLYAANRVIIATSQIYSSAQSAINGANSVIANAEKANVEDQTLKNFTEMPFPKWEIYKDKGNQYRFRLCATNGSCICHSQGYTSKANCKNGIESIIKTVKNAKIDKKYINKN